MGTWKIAGINFDHFHMGDNLRMASEHPDVEIVGLCDLQPNRLEEAARNFGISKDRLFTDHDQCLAETEPDIVLLCPATADHAEWTERWPRLGSHSDGKAICRDPRGSGPDDCRHGAQREDAGHQLALGLVSTASHDEAIAR